MKDDKLNQHQSMMLQKIFKAINRKRITYLHDLLNYCLAYNNDWYELISNHRQAQYAVIMQLQNVRSYYPDLAQKDQERFFQEFALK